MLPIRCSNNSPAKKKGDLQEIKNWCPVSLLHGLQDPFQSAGKPSERGDGSSNSPSRTATFRIQFIQKYLAGPQDVVWKQVTSSILRGTTGLGLDMALFLMDFKLLTLY